MTSIIGKALGSVLAVPFSNRLDFLDTDLKNKNTFYCPCSLVQTRLLDLKDTSFESFVPDSVVAKYV